jgi:hypothetical protein
MAMYLWVMMLCILIGRYQNFGETYCLHLQAWIDMLSLAPLVSTCKSTHRHNPEQHNHHLHHCRNLKSHSVSRCFCMFNDYSSLYILEHPHETLFKIQCGHTKYFTLQLLSHINRCVVWLINTCYSERQKTAIMNLSCINYDSAWL